MSVLAGKVALVTGGSRGIGAAIARRLAGDGADVALTFGASEGRAREVVAAVEAAGRRGLALRADAAQPAAVVAAVEETVRRLGRLDILVNNAGIFLAKPFAEFTPEEVDRTIAINIRAVFLGAQAASRHMGEGGRIITIGSCIAERVPGPGLTLYALSKSALIGLTKGMARDLGPRAITANLIQPGPTDTDMNPADGPNAGTSRAHLAVPRFGEVDDIAGMAAYLAGPQGRYVTGAAISVDGGYAA